MEHWAKMGQVQKAYVQSSGLLNPVLVKFPIVTLGSNLEN